VSRYRSGWLRPAATLAGVLLLYFTVPGRVSWSDGGFLASVLLMVAGVGLLAWAIVGQVRRQLTGDANDLHSLVMLLALVLVVFAFGFYLLEQSRPDEVAGLRTRVDSLYFTLATIATVGYGDVHAEGQVARAIVASQMVFNIVFVGALASVLAGRVRVRAHERMATRDASSSVPADLPPVHSMTASAWASGLATTEGDLSDTGTPVDERTTHMLTGLTVGDLSVLRPPPGEGEQPGEGGLDLRSAELVRFASLVALDASPGTYRAVLSAAAGAGVTPQDLLGALQAVAPQAGAVRVATAATQVMAALGLTASAPSAPASADDTNHLPRSPA
jgi:alkylhydroperoxidase/carboxymuconolactone decarboxylase family protein YurZ